ncbi:MAG TPA: hypothetical protein PLP01_16220 [Phycisphaerae bacterium]|nr:hypothetical protein [Phycisphaerae bacterium]
MGIQLADDSRNFLGELEFGGPDRSKPLEIVAEFCFFKPVESPFQHSQFPFLGRREFSLSSFRNQDTTS